MTVEDADAVCDGLDAYNKEMQKQEAKLKRG
jgi:hypothetical protein